jgi:hypothetical protein
MSEHRFNPAALAKANGPATQQTQVIDIGRGTGLIGFEIRPMIDADGIAHAMLIAIGGKVSQFAPMTPIGVVCGELGRIPVKELHRHFLGLEPETEEVPS